MHEAIRRLFIENKSVSFDYKSLPESRPDTFVMRPIKGCHQMKKTGTYLMITGGIIVLVALIFFPTTYPLNAVDSETPAVTITGTGYFPWKIFAGTIVIAIGAVFRFVDATGPKGNRQLS